MTVSKYWNELRVLGDGLGRMSTPPTRRFVRHSTGHSVSVLGSSQTSAAKGVVGFRSEKVCSHLLSRLEGDVVQCLGVDCSDSYRLEGVHTTTEHPGPHVGRSYDPKSVVVVGVGVVPVEIEGNLT